MSNWITLTADDAYDYLSDDQLDVLREESLAPGQSDPVEQAVLDVAARLRAEIAAPGYPLSALPHSLPPELRSVALALVVECAQTRLPALELSTDQIRAANNARLYMQRVSRGEVPVSLPEGEIESDGFTTKPPETPPTHVRVVSARRGHLSSRSLRGL